MKLEEIIYILLIVLVLIVLMALLLLGWTDMVSADEGFTDAEIVNAIFYAEGGMKATYYYGIRSVHYDDIEEARRICFNTVRNNRGRCEKKYGRPCSFDDYFHYLSGRYCPIGASNDPEGKNVNWEKNVKYFLNNPKDVNHGK